MLIPKRINDAIFVQKLLFMNYLNACNVTKNIFKALKKPKKSLDENGKYKRYIHSTKYLRRNLNSNSGDASEAISKGKHQSVEINNINQSKYNDNTATKLQTTTAKQTEEKIKQKIEKLEEVSLVPQGQSEKNIPGFNIEPKILGLNTAAYWQFYNLIKTQTNNHMSDAYYDEIARRCIHCHTYDVDKCLLKEIKKIKPENAWSDNTLHDVGKNRHYYVKWSPKKQFDGIHSKFSSGKVCKSNLIPRNISKLHRRVQKSNVREYDSNNVHSDALHPRANIAPDSILNKPSDLIDKTTPVFQVKERKPEIFASKYTLLDNVIKKEKLEGSEKGVDIKLNKDTVEKTININNYIKSLNQPEIFNVREYETNDQTTTGKNISRPYKPTDTETPMYQIRKAAGSTAKSGLYSSKRSVSAKLDPAKCLNHVQVKFSDGMFEIHSLNRAIPKKFSSLWDKSGIISKPSICQSKETKNMLSPTIPLHSDLETIVEPTKIDDNKLKGDMVKNKNEIKYSISQTKLFDAKDGMSSKVIPEMWDFDTQHPTTANSKAYIGPIKATNGDMIHFDPAKCLNHVQIKFNSGVYEIHSLIDKPRAYAASSESLNKPLEIYSALTPAFHNKKTKPNITATEYSNLNTIGKQFPERSIEETIVSPTKDDIKPHDESAEADNQSENIISNIVLPKIKENDDAPKIWPKPNKESKEMLLSEMLIKIRERNQADQLASKCPPDPCKDKKQPKPASNPCGPRQSPSNRPCGPGSRTKPKPAPNPCAPSKRGGCAKFSSAVLEAFSNHAYFVRMDTDKYKTFPIFDIIDGARDRTRN